jgi:hypothetical protein
MAVGKLLRDTVERYRGDRLDEDDSVEDEVGATAVWVSIGTAIGLWDGEKCQY